MKFYSIRNFANAIGVSPQTLRLWDKSGKLKPHHISTGGHRYYSEEQLFEVTKSKSLIENNNRIIIGYCRVSSKKQADDLKRQQEAMQLYLLSQGKPFKIISDIGSGLNYKKSGLIELIDMITLKKVEKIVVMYKDRLVRFGFELIEHIASLYGTTIEIIDNTPKTEKQELVEDLVQIITVYSSKLHGKRSSKTKKIVEQLVSDINNEHVD